MNTSKYQPNGWLTKQAMQYGNQHRQNKNDAWDVRFKGRHKQFVVELVKVGTEDEISESSVYLDIGKARAAYKEKLGKVPAKIKSPDYKQEIIL